MYRYVWGRVHQRRWCARISNWSFQYMYEVYCIATIGICVILAINVWSTYCCCNAYIVEQRYRLVLSVMEKYCYYRHPVEHDPNWCVFSYCGKRSAGLQTSSIHLLWAILPRSWYNDGFLLWTSFYIAQQTLKQLMLTSTFKFAFWKLFYVGFSFFLSVFLFGFHFLHISPCIEWNSDERDIVIKNDLRLIAYSLSLLSFFVFLRSHRASFST